MADEMEEPTLVSTDTLTVTLTVAQAIALVQGCLPSIPTGDIQYDADFVAAQDVLGAALEEKARG